MELHYETFGSGPPVIILHGLLGFSGNWLSIGKILAEWYTVYLPDLRNHGSSPHSEQMSYPVMAGDIEEFCLSRGLSSPCIIGHSMGGKAAMEFALTRPDMADRLIVLDIAPKAYAPVYKNVFPLLKNIEIDTIDRRAEAEARLKKEIPDKVLRMFLLKNLGREKDGSFRWKINIDGLAANYHNIWAGIQPGRVYSGPVLFVRGGMSDLIDEKDEGEIREYFPYAGIETVEGAGHWIHIDKPDTLIRLIHSFIADGEIS